MRIQDAQAQFERHRGILRRVLEATFADGTEAAKFERYVLSRLDAAAADWDSCDAAAILDLVRETLVDYLPAARFESTVFACGADALAAGQLEEPAVRLVIDLLLVDGLPASQWARPLRIRPGAILAGLTHLVGDGTHSDSGAAPTLRRLIETGQIQPGPCSTCAAQAQALTALRASLADGRATRTSSGSISGRGEPTQPIAVIRRATGTPSTAAGSPASLAGATATGLAAGLARGSAPAPLAQRLAGTRAPARSTQRDAARSGLEPARGAALGVVLPLMFVAVIPAFHALVHHSSGRQAPPARPGTVSTLPAASAAPATAPTDGASGLTLQLDHEPARALADGAQVEAPVSSTAHITVGSSIDLWLESGSKAQVYHDHLVLALGIARVQVGTMGAPYFAEADPLRLMLSEGLYVLRRLAHQRPSLLVVRGHAAATGVGNAPVKGVEAWAGGQIVMAGDHAAAADATPEELAREQATTGTLALGGAHQAEEDAAPFSVGPIDATSWRSWANQLAQGGHGTHAAGGLTGGDYRSAF